MKLVAILLSAVLVTAAAAADRSIPKEAPVLLEQHGRPVEVSVENVERYRCRQGHLVASSEGSAGRTTTRKLTLRCV